MNVDSNRKPLPLRKGWRYCDVQEKTWEMQRYFVIYCTQWIRDARVLSRLAKSNLIFEWHAYVDERVYTRIQYIGSNILTCCLSIVRGLSGI